MIDRSRSAALFDRAQAVMPGGVSSPVRAFRAVGGIPPVVRRAAGAEIEDLDGNRYLDFVGSWGPLVLGHAHPAVLEAIHEAVDRGTTYGTPCRAETELAEKLVMLHPGLERVRFVSTGTEATMSAVRLARGATGRDHVVKFSGCYHGHVDSLLVAAGSGLRTFGHPSSAGVPRALAELTHVLPLDDEARVRALFASEGGSIAAVIIEPVPANHGLLVQRREFLECLRQECDRSGALLIFDEVITGLRLGPGGASERFGVVPDLVTLGKVIGGGLPVGAFGGSRALMRHLAPDGPVYQAGTLSGNPVAMAAGSRAIRVLEEEDGWARLEALGRHLETSLGAALAEAPFGANVASIGSLFWLSLQSGPLPRSAERIGPDAERRYRPIFRALLDRCIALAPSAFEVGFLSLAHRTEDVDRLADALRDALRGEPAEDRERPAARPAPEGRRARRIGSNGDGPRPGSNPMDGDRTFPLVFGGNELDLRTRRARAWDGSESVLTEREARLLEVLSEREGEILSREEILEKVWGYDLYPATRAIDTLVRRLRNRFEVDGENPKHLHTVRGVGYLFTRERVPAS